MARFGAAASAEVPGQYKVSVHCGGAHVADARISVFPRRVGSELGRTDSTGRFVIPTSAYSKGTYIAWHPTCGVSDPFVPAQDGGLITLPGTLALEIEAVDTSGRPLSGRAVAYPRPPPNFAFQLFEADGVRGGFSVPAVINVSTGGLALDVGAPDYTLERAVLVLDGSRSVAKVTLHPRASFSGTIVLDGPHESARIKAIAPADEPEVVTMQDGGFALSLPLRRAQGAWVTAPGYYPVLLGSLRTNVTGVRIVMERARKDDGARPGTDGVVRIFGVGVVLGEHGEILQLVPGKDGEKQIHVGERILSVDGVEIWPLPRSQVVHLLRGWSETPVDLVLSARSGERRVTVIRSNILLSTAILGKTG